MSSEAYREVGWYVIVKMSSYTDKETESCCSKDSKHRVHPSDVFCPHCGSKVIEQEVDVEYAYDVTEDFEGEKPDFYTIGIPDEFELEDGEQVIIPMFDAPLFSFNGTDIDPTTLNTNWAEQFNLIEQKLKNNKMFESYKIKFGSFIWYG